MGSSVNWNRIDLLRGSDASSGKSLYGNFSELEHLRLMLKRNYLYGNFSELEPLRLAAALSGRQFGTLFMRNRVKWNE